MERKRKRDHSELLGSTRRMNNRNLYPTIQRKQCIKQGSLSIHIKYGK